MRLVSSPASVKHYLICLVFETRSYWLGTHGQSCLCLPNTTMTSLDI